MSGVKRYSFDIDERYLCDCGNGDRVVSIEVDRGNYVLASDYDRLAQECEMRHLITGRYIDQCQRLRDEISAMKGRPSARTHDSVGDWRIDTSAGREILVYKDCSVIEEEDARYVLGLIAERDELRAQVDTMRGLLSDIRFFIEQPRTVIDSRYVLLSRIDAALQAKP